MEMAGPLINKEVLSYDNNVINENNISKLLSKKSISSSMNEEDIVLEPCVLGDRVGITRPNGVANEYF